MILRDRRGKSRRKRSFQSRRLTAGLLAFLMLFNTVIPGIVTADTAYASTIGPVGTVLPKLRNYMDNTLQCIDAFSELGPNGGYQHDDDSYVRVLPSSSLSKEDEGLLFWALFFIFGVIPSSDDSKYPDMDFTGIRDAYGKVLPAHAGVIPRPRRSPER